MPGSPLSYKEVIFEALKEWLEEEQVGQRITVVYTCRTMYNCTMYSVHCTPMSCTFLWLLRCSITLMVKVSSLVAVEWRSVVRRIRLVGPNCTTFE